MRGLVLTPQFERAFRRLVGKRPSLEPQIEAALRRMAADVGDPWLKTHHLSGQLKGSTLVQLATIAGLFFPDRKIPKPAPKCCSSLTLARPKKCIEPTDGESQAFTTRWARKGSKHPTRQTLK